MSIRLICPSCGQVYRTAGDSEADAIGMAQKGCQECGFEALEIVTDAQLPSNGPAAERRLRSVEDAR